MDIGTELLIRYAVCGIVGWVMWFIFAMVYIVKMVGFDPSEFRAIRRYFGLDDEKKQKFTVKDIVEYILWPYGLMKASNELVNSIQKYLAYKEQR